MPTIGPLCDSPLVKLLFPTEARPAKRIHCDQCNPLSSSNKNLKMHSKAKRCAQPSNIASSGNVEDWQRWLRLVKLQTVPTSPFSLFASSSLLPRPSDVPLLADCYFMYYCRRQLHIKLSGVSLFFCPPSPATSHAILARALPEQRCIFLSKRQRYLSLWPNVGDAERKRGLWWDPHRPPGVKEAFDGLLKRYNSDPRPS